MNLRKTKINTRTGLAAIGACAVLGIAACGGTPTEEEAIDALVESFDSDDGADLSDTEVRCVSTDIVESLGAERSLEIDENDLDGNLPAEEADVVTDAFLDCIDVQEFFRSIFAEDPELAGIPQAFTDCLIEQIGDEGLRTALVSQFSGEGDADALSESIGADAGAACIDVLTPEELEELAAG